MFSDWALEAWTSSGFSVNCDNLLLDLWPPLPSSMAQDASTLLLSPFQLVESIPPVDARSNHLTFQGVIGASHPTCHLPDQLLDGNFPSPRLSPVWSLTLREGLHLPATDKRYIEFSEALYEVASRHKKQSQFYA